MDAMKLYQIRDMTTGKYCTGCTYPNWNASGKIWRSLHTCLAHIRAAMQYYDLFGSNKELVEFDVTPVSEGGRSLREVLDEQKDKKAKMAKQRETKRIKKERARLLEQVAQLDSKLEHK